MGESNGLKLVLHDAPLFRNHYNFHVKISLWQKLTLFAVIYLRWNPFCLTSKKKCNRCSNIIQIMIKITVRQWCGCGILLSSPMV